MSDQAENLRQLIRTPLLPANAERPGLPMMLVAGGRGGVGATTVAVNLAAVLADAGDRVLVVDAAENRGDLAIAAGIRRNKIEYTLSDVLAERCTLEEALIAGPAGTKVLAAAGCAASRPTRESRRDSATCRQAQQRLFAELQTLDDQFDLQVIDLGCGLAPWTRRFWLQARLVLLVTTTDSSALLDTYAMIKRSVADGTGPEIRLVVNQCDDHEVASSVACRLSESCRQFLGRGVPAAPSLPRQIDDFGAARPPRVWEAPNTSFGHAMLWLGRAVGDVLSLAADEMRVEAA